MPHWQPEGAAFFVTWRLYGSLPPAALERIEATRRLLAREDLGGRVSVSERRVRQAKKLFAVVDEMLDSADGGPLWLRQESIAALVEHAILERYRKLYSLWAYVLMANHVHVLLRPKLADASPGRVPLAEITKYLKGYTAREANSILSRTGQPFWQSESFDHWARDADEFHRIVSYVENNPVKAGLVSRPEDWMWSSASERRRRGWANLRPLT
ncbi:MAG: transposase [Rubrivivax sp.]|nr:transposase [Pyrinomonadaceae bacterium]